MTAAMLAVMLVVMIAAHGPRTGQVYDRRPRARHGLRPVARHNTLPLPTRLSP